MRNKMSKSVMWKLLERFGVLGVQFLLQIILARLLSPEHYGALSIMVIFTTLANVFVQNGFNTALIQNKDVSEKDYSSVFWISLGIAGGLYAVIYFIAPAIALFYDMPDIMTPLRVLALMLFPGALNSVQYAKISREMDFKKVFYSNIGGVIISGIIGIIIAYLGGGLWALVAQTLLNVLVSCLVMFFTAKLKIYFTCDIGRVKVLFSYGWKLLVSSLLDTLYADLNSLVIGKKYNTDTLGYYSRGKQFPQFICNAVNGALQSVLLPAMAAEQDDKNKVKDMMKMSMMLSVYILFPVMAGLAAVAPAVVNLLLGEKWLLCVPYLQVYCFVFAFYPVHSCNLQAINSIGRSDIFLKLEVIKKSYNIIVLIIVVYCFDSPLAIAMSGIITTWIGWYVNSFPNKKLIKYSYLEQIIDVIPSIIMAGIMFICVGMVGKLVLGEVIVTLMFQIIVGVITYLLLSIIIKPIPYRLLVNWVKKEKDNCLLKS